MQGEFLNEGSAACGSATFSDYQPRVLSEDSPGGRTTRLGCDTRQPNRVLANAIAGNNAEWWPGAGKVGLTAAKHERAEVETIFVDKTEIGEARRHDGPRDV